MSGEIWRRVFQAAKETTYGVPVAATRKMYFEPSSNLTRDRSVNRIKASTGTRDQVVDAKARSVVAGGQVVMPLGAAEIVEVLLMGIKGGVAPTTTLGASTWVFTPGNSLDSATLEWYDGYRAWQGAGMLANQLRIARSAGENSDVTLTADLFGKDVVVMGGGLTGSLTDRVPEEIEGWETAIYIDNFGATPGTTLVSNTLISADLTIANNMGRKYFGDNTIATGQVTTGEIEITGQFTFEANAGAYAEYQNRDSATKRLVRLQFGNNTGVGTGAAKKTVNIDIPGAWEAIDITQTDQGTAVYRFNYGYVRDPVNAFPIQFTVINGRSVAWT
jgi:hypothetical protein